MVVGASISIMMQRMLLLIVHHSRVEEHTNTNKIQVGALYFGNA
jgi:hypothetical protein